MSKKIKKAILISSVIVVIIIVAISTFFIIKKQSDKAKIDKVIETYSDDNVQQRLEKYDNESLVLNIDDEQVIGVIKIDKIGFEGLVYEGTSLSTLAKGVGHFDNTSYLNGNVCLAAHNTNSFWAKLHTLQNGDKITYISFLGTK